MAFVKGISGNPSGRPPGARNKATIALEALLEDEAESVGRKCVELAKSGDTVAIKLVLDRICPARRGRIVRFNCPEAIKSTSDVTDVLSEVLVAIAEGELTPEEASSIAQVLEIQRRAIEIVDIEGRLSALERRVMHYE